MTSFQTFQKAHKTQELLQSAVCISHLIKNYDGKNFFSCTYFFRLSLSIYILFSLKKKSWAFKHIERWTVSKHSNGYLILFILLLYYTLYIRSSNLYFIHVSISNAHSHNMYLQATDDIALDNCESKVKNKLVFIEIR